MAKVISLHAGGFELEVTLLGVRPAIWRRLRLAGSLTLRDLHHVLQIALGWNDSHLHEFRIGETRYGMLVPGAELAEPLLDERAFRLDRLLRKEQPFEYLYDFGDGWEHEVELKKNVALTPGAPKAECLDGDSAGPPDDCGGAANYMNILQAFARPKRAASREALQWVPRGFDPRAFDLAAVNRELRTAGTKAFLRKRERFYDGH